VISCATAAFKESDYSRALELFTQALSRADPNAFDQTQKATLHLNIANTLFRLEKYIPAIESCTAALALNRSNAKALWRRGNCYFELCRFGPAEKDIIEAVKLDGYGKKEWHAKRGEVRRANKRSHFEWLELTSDSVAQRPGSLKLAYRKQCLTWHPDRNLGNAEATERAKNMFCIMQEAYSVLSDPRKKLEYMKNRGEL